MKILLIHNYHQYYGGEEAYVESLEKLLKSHGHQVYLYTKNSGDVKTIWNKIGIGLGLFWNLKTKKELTKIIQEFQPDIAYFNNVYPSIGATAYLTCHKNRVPIIQMIHNYQFMCPKGVLFRKGRICELCIHKSFKLSAVLFGCYHVSHFASFVFALAFFVHKKILKSFDKISIFIFPSEFTKKYYQKCLSIPEKKTIYLQHFVDTDMSKEVLKKSDYFLFVGRLSEEKGIVELLEMFKNLPQHQLKVIGDGPLKKQVDLYKDVKNIEIVGFLPREKTFSYMRRAKAVIISSIWYEVYPLAYIESIINNGIVFVPENTNFKKNIQTGRQIIFYKAGDFRNLRMKITNFIREEVENKNLFAEYKSQHSSQYYYKNIIRIFRTFSS